MAFLTVAIWGTTFVWTKLLITNGLSPAQIFTLRFAIAYLLMLLFTLVVRRKISFKWWADCWRDELLMVALGVTGGSAYFLMENEALRFTTATNVSLIVCSCPLFTMFASKLFRREDHLSWMQISGAVMATLGMAAVVLNGHFVLHLSPLGDVLAFAACISWMVYSLLLRDITVRYSSLFITRKVFFYGLLTILPYYGVVPELPSLDVLFRPQVLGNLAFLGCVASMVCYLIWNWALAHLGAVKCTNWVYFNPVSTMIFGSFVLGEDITLYFLLGATLIMSGLLLSERR